MKVIRTIKGMQRETEKLRKHSEVIGFIPTMGYLHEGHIKLIREAKKISTKVVVSIFVNPIQFAQGEDFERYPRDEKRDIKICKGEGVDYVFIPDVREMYPDGFETFVEVVNLQRNLCGASRPGHFRGVTTVVAKLFNIVKPHYAFFGLKDYQQALIIKKMVRDLNFDVKILTVETVREEDGLAKSSRNEYLGPEERRKAVAISQSLAIAKKMLDEGKEIEEVKREACEFLERKGTKVDYFEIVHPETLEPIRNSNTLKNGYAIATAVFLGKARLIDNIVVKGNKIINMDFKTYRRIIKEV